MEWWVVKKFKVLSQNFYRGTKKYHEIYLASHCSSRYLKPAHPKYEKDPWFHTFLRRTLLGFYFRNIEVTP
jgi:hypothetical protein